VFRVESKSKKLWAVKLALIIFLFFKADALTNVKIGHIAISTCWHVRADFVCWSPGNLIAFASFKIWNSMITACWHVGAVVIPHWNAHTHIEVRDVT